MKKKLLYISILLSILVGSILMRQTFDDETDNNGTNHGPRVTSGYIPKDGFVPDKTTALKIAKAVWTPIYGKKDLRWRTYYIELDNNIWIIEGSNIWAQLISASSGGPYIEIDKENGTILKVIHTK
ncbi:MAG: YbbC/YhhH family protein [Treponema sp.]|jgi:hypothetical protein|nr:YbbC/YhhH family protein [Treponema sp.]